MKETAKEARRAYYKRYYQENKERIRAYQKQWRKDNPEACRQYESNRWEKVAEKLEA